MVATNPAKRAPDETARHVQRDLPQKVTAEPDCLHRIVQAGRS